MDFQLRDGTLVVAIPSDFIFSNKEECRKRVLEELENGCKDFELNFAENEYVDAHALGMFPTICKKVHERHGRISMIGVRDDLISLLKSTGVGVNFDEVIDRAGKKVHYT